MQDVELAITLLYQLGEGAAEETLKPGSGTLGQLATGAPPQHLLHLNLLHLNLMHLVPLQLDHLYLNVLHLPSLLLSLLYVNCLHLYLLRPSLLHLHAFACRPHVFCMCRTFTPVFIK